MGVPKTNGIGSLYNANAVAGTPVAAPGRSVHFSPPPAPGTGHPTTRPPPITSPPPPSGTPKKKEKRYPDRVSINIQESDVQEICVTFTDVITVNHNRYACAVFEMPFQQNNDDDLVNISISANGRQATLTMTYPKEYLVPSKVVGCELYGKGNIVTQSIRQWSRENMRKRGDKVSFELVLDLPFAAESRTSPDLFPTKMKSGQVYAMTRLGTYPSACPEDFLSTCFFVFKERGQGFTAKTTMEAVQLKLNDAAGDY